MAEISQLRDKIESLKVAEAILLEAGIQDTSLRAIEKVVGNLESQIRSTLPRELLEQQNADLTNANIQLKLELDGRTRQMNRIIADLKLELSQRPPVYAIHCPDKCEWLHGPYGEIPVFLTTDLAQEFMVSRGLSSIWRVTQYFTAPIEDPRELTIADFFGKHKAYGRVQDWALANCKDMQECWDKLPDGDLIWIAGFADVLTDRTQRLFAVACCREAYHLLEDQRSRDALYVAESYALGQSDSIELYKAWNESQAVGNHWKNGTAKDLAATAAAFAASADPLQAAREASNYAIKALAAASPGCEAEVQAAQARWLRDNCKPNFKGW